MQIGKF